MAVSLVGLLLLVVILRSVVETSVNAIPYDHRFIPTAKSAQVASLGFETLLADLYWLDFIQYVGDSDARSIDKFANAYKYLDLVTSLDPHLVSAYYFAAFILGQELQNPNQASVLINRGIAANPDNWYLPYIAGINQYLYAHDELKAAKYYRMAAKYPDAPKWLAPQADILAAKIPTIVKEINIWDSVYYNATNPGIKERAGSKLAELWSQIYSSSPTIEIRNRARHELSKLLRKTGAP